MTWRADTSPAPANASPHRGAGDDPDAVRALNGPARLLVAMPAGAQAVVAALCDDPPSEPRSRLALALDAGVELLL